MRFSFNLPDDKFDAVIGAFANANGYQETIADSNNQVIPNPQTREQFAKKFVRDLLIHSYAESLAQSAAQTARHNARQGVGGDV